MIKLRRAIGGLAVAASLLGLAGCVISPPPIYGGTVYSAPPTQPAPDTAPTQPYTPAPQYDASFCAAGVYQCPIPSNTPVGTTCSCPGLGAPSFGTAQ